MPKKAIKGTLNSVDISELSNSNETKASIGQELILSIIDGKKQSNLSTNEILSIYDFIRFYDNLSDTSHSHYYKLMGLDRDCTKKDVINHYRRISVILQPDNYLNSSKVTIECIKELYSIYSRVFDVLNKEKSDKVRHNTNSQDSIMRELAQMSMFSKFRQTVHMKYIRDILVYQEVSLKQCYFGDKIIKEVEFTDKRREFELIIPRGIPNNTLLFMTSVFTVDDISYNVNALVRVNDNRNRRRQDDLFMRSNKFDSPPTQIAIFGKRTKLPAPTRIQDDFYIYKGLGFTNEIKQTIGDLYVPRAKQR